MLRATPPIQDTARKKGATQKQIRFPAPVGGLNFLANMLDMPAADCFVCDNFIPRAFGLEIRKGWKYHLEDEFQFGGAVKSVMSYIAHDPTDSRLFVGIDETDSPIYDATTAGTAPTVPEISDSGIVRPGEFYSVMYLTEADSYLCVVAEGGGYWTYNAGAGWVQRVDGSAPGEIEFPMGSTVTTADFAFVFVWKNRLWFLERDSAVAWYLPIGQIAGQVESFDFGPLMAHGGSLDFGVSWTYDGGAGIDDMLVLCGHNGDVLIYQGTDPATAAEFRQRGSWYAGRLPVGRRAFTQHGGDLLLLTELGCMSVTDLVSGRLVTSGISSFAAKYNPRLARFISDSVNDEYWFLVPILSEEIVYVGSQYPDANNGIIHGYLANSITRAWATTSNMSMLSAANHDGGFYFGTPDGYLCQGFTGFRDGASFDGANIGSEVGAQMMGAFFSFNTPNQNKRAQRVRVLGLADGQPALYAKLQGEYDLSGILTVPAPIGSSGSLWDAGIWDAAFWQAARATWKRWFGVNGWGKLLSFQLALKGSGYTLFTDYEVTYEDGLGF